jgi:hypothetical protein
MRSLLAGWMVRLLLRLIDGEETAATILPTELVIRESA